MESFVNKHRASHATIGWSQNVSANHSHQPTSTLFTNLFTSMFCFQQKANEYSRETNIIKDLFSPFQNMCSSNFQVSIHSCLPVCQTYRRSDSHTKHACSLQGAARKNCCCHRTHLLILQNQKKVLGYRMVHGKVKLNSHLRIQVRITYK